MGLGCRCMVLMMLWTLGFMASANTPGLGQALSENIRHRYLPTINTMSESGWDHANSTVLHGMEKLYLKDGDPAKLNYIRAYVDEFVDEKGQIKDLRDNLDGIHPGILLLFLYEHTGENKYWLAAAAMRNHLLGDGTRPGAIPQTPEGGYWHKNLEKYRGVMTVDGLYMAYPFLLRYGLLARDPQAVDVALQQTLMVSEKSFNPEAGLPYHAWDYTKTKSWVNPLTGQSSQFWSRASGWYAMALVDMLEALPREDARYPLLMDYFKALAAGLIHWQEPHSGMWFQVLDKAGEADNHPEMAGTGMIVYALAKGHRLGFLPASAENAAKRGWAGMQTNIGRYTDGGIQVNSVAPGMGCQDSYQDYVAIRPVSIPRPQGKQHSHGYVALLMAASEME